jgi:GxxExxY protein
MEVATRMDDVIVVEVKSVDTLAPIHQSQLLTYLKLSGRRLGFLMNFNVRLLKEGLRRVAL